MRRAIGRTAAIVAGAALVVTAFGGGAAVGRRSKNNPFIAKAVGRITVESRGPSATGFGITDVAQPLGGGTDAVCITTSRAVTTAVATPDDNNGLQTRTVVSIPPAPGTCADGATLLVRLYGANSGSTFYFVAY